MTAAGICSVSAIAGMAGLIGDGGDAEHVRGVDYTRSLRAAKLGEQRVLRALAEVLPPGVEVVTQAWSTPEGDPVIMVEMTVEVWMRWARRARGESSWWCGSRRDPASLRQAVRATLRAGRVPLPELWAARVQDLAVPLRWPPVIVDLIDVREQSA